MANDTLKLQIEIEKSQAEQALDDIQQKASIEFEVDTDKAEDNLDKVQDKLEDVGDKAEETGEKISKSFVASLGVAVKHLGTLLSDWGKLNQATQEQESWWSRGLRYTGAGLKAAWTGAKAGGATGAIVGAAGGSAAGGVGVIPGAAAGGATGAVIGGVSGFIGGFGHALYQDQIAEEKRYDREMEKLDKDNLKAKEQRDKQAAKEQEREQKRIAREAEREARRRERDDERKIRQAEREEKKRQRDEEQQRKKEEREAETARKEQERLDRDLRKQMVKDFLQAADDGIAAERTKQGEIRGEMGLLSESQSAVVSSLGKMGLYANTADISNVGNAENYRLQMLDLTKQLVESMNEQVRLTSGKREVQSLWQ